MLVIFSRRASIEGVTDAQQETDGRGRNRGRKPTTVGLLIMITHQINKVSLIRLP